jgi:hypothetical protein
MRRASGCACTALTGRRRRARAAGGRLSRWQLRLPFRGRDELLADMGVNARHLDDPLERAVARHVVLAGAAMGLRTSGQLLDYLTGLDAGARRVLLDAARARSGAPSTADAEGREVHQRAQRALASHPPRDEHGTFQICAAAGCFAHPTAGPFHLPATSSAKRWFCPRHADQAQPGDLEPPEERFVLGLDCVAHAVGAEAERERLEAEELLESDRRRGEERQAAAEQRAAWKDAREQERLAELPSSYRGGAP